RLRRRGRGLARSVGGHPDDRALSGPRAERPARRRRRGGALGGLLEGLRRLALAARVLRQEGLERAADLLRRERPLARLLREQLREQRRDVRGQLELRRRRGLVGVRLEQLRRRAGEGRRAGEHLVEHAAERVEIAAEADE